jgi:hypothetical protein
MENDLRFGVSTTRTLYRLARFYEPHNSGLDLTLAPKVSVAFLPIRGDASKVGADSGQRSSNRNR